MKLHAAKIIIRTDSTKTTTLCGRMNSASHDGMNIADDHQKVTCKFCLQLIARNALKEGL